MLRVIRYEKQKEEEARAKEEERLGELTDAQLMKHLLEREDEADVSHLIICMFIAKAVIVLAHR